MIHDGTNGGLIKIDEKLRLNKIFSPSFYFNNERFALNKFPEILKTAACNLVKT